MNDLVSPDFAFSQSSLHTFNYCRRRFYLRYIKKLIWPAQLVGNPQFVKDRDAGIRFHRIVNQYFLGFDAELLRKVAEADPDPRLIGWMETFLMSKMAHLDGDLHSEAIFNASVANRRLNAKVDLLQLQPGSIKIFDWKTSRLLPKLSSLKKQAQSRIYPLVISRVFSYEAFDSLTMVYWEANFPDQTIEIKSSSSDWKIYEQEIAALIELILSLKAEEFVPTPDKQKCASCEYRSYCHRGNAAPFDEELQEVLIDDEVKIPEDTIDSWGSV